MTSSNLPQLYLFNIHMYDYNELTENPLGPVSPGSPCFPWKDIKKELNQNGSTVHIYKLMM